MWKTAALYAEKPAPLMSAELMLLEKLKLEKKEKLMSLGLSRKIIDQRHKEEGNYARICGRNHQKNQKNQLQQNKDKIYNLVMLRKKKYLILIQL